MTTDRGNKSMIFSLGCEHGTCCWRNPTCTYRLIVVVLDPVSPSGRGIASAYRDAEAQKDKVK